MSSTTATAMTVASGASALVPFTQTFVQTNGSETTTVAYTLVGQVLDNGQTNWVGYDDGTAEYLYTGSVANAQQTTLDGETYYVSSGSAPAGYLATAGGDDDDNGDATATSGSAAMTTTTSDASTSSDASGSSTRPTSTTRQTSTTGSGSAAQTSMPSSGHRVSAGAAFAVAIGLLAVIAL